MPGTSAAGRCFFAFLIPAGLFPLSANSAAISQPAVRRTPTAVPVFTAFWNGGPKTIAGQGFTGSSRLDLSPGVVLPIPPLPDS
ncbi:MAG: hypothetical protein HZB91_08890 [Elusimicrobia bacterium]|nr:hypothetical protein [Elusimicrobiota bacterium]